MKKETLHIYSRVSTASQADVGTSLDSQKDSGIQRATELGMDYEIHDEEAASSSKEDFSNRPVLMQVLRGIEDGSIKNLYVYKTDRLSRNTTTWAIIRTKLKDANCILYTSDGKTDLTSHMDNLIFGILSEIAQYDNELRTERLKEGKRQKALRGYWFGGPAPFGYKVSSEKKLILDKTQSKWVSKIYEWYGDGKSPKWIKSRLDGQVPTNRGKEIWSIGSVEAILRNTHPRGFYRYHDKDIPCPSIVTDDTWEAVQHRLEDRKSNRKRGNNQTVYEYPLKEVMYCSHCGSRMGGRSSKTKNGYRLSYACTSKANNWRTMSEQGDWDRSKSCVNNASMEAAITEQTVWDSVLLVLEQSKFRREEFKNELLLKKDDDAKERSEAVNASLRKIARQRESIAAIEDAIAEQEVRKIVEQTNVSQIERTLEALRKEHDRLRTELVSLENEQRLILESENWVDWYSEYFRDIKDLSKTTPEDRIAVVKKYVDRIDVSFNPETRNHKLSIHFALPIVGDKIEWKDTSEKSLGYDLHPGSDSIEVGLAKK